MRGERLAETDQADLGVFVSEASSLCERLIGEVSYDEDDHLGFMILAFLCKLAEQAAAVQMLVQYDHGRDAELVARSMLETMASLIWAAQDPEDRAFRWRGFAYVEDFKLIQSQKSQGIPVDGAVEQGNRDFLRTNSTVFEDPKRAGKANPYYADWKCGMRISGIFTAVGGRPLYTELYGPLSDWIHAGVKSIGDAISRNEKTIQWLPASASTNATALSVAFQSIAEVLRLATNHFRSDLRSDLDDTVKRFQGRFRPTLHTGREA